MMRSKKIAKRLAARKEAFLPTMPGSGQKCQMPGSQNRKK